ncbi:hypothetical protein JB92DRAFT_952422 [Gautieria morchelliformis]|nr:hypothetical protein JB92DRAFT_952422 [Gautieria morchelliformis]
MSSPQLTGVVTVTRTFPLADTSVLNADPSHAGSSGLVAPTITVSSTAPATTSTIIAAANSSPSASSSSSKVHIGLIIGLAVGIFALLAVALIVFMTIRHKKRRRASRSRAISAPTKPWSRINDDPEPAQLQMRATNLAQTASIAGSTARSKEDSSLPHHSTRALVLNPGNPFSAAQSSDSGHTQRQAAPTPSRSTDETHIPNPFVSPKGSPSHSPSASHTSTYSSHDHSIPVTTALSSFTQHTPQYGHASTITASSYSDYAPSEFPVQLDEPSDAVKPVKPAHSVTPHAPPNLLRKQSKKEADETRSRELRAMQDLISALDERSQNTKAPPSAFGLRVNTSAAVSRLSMGEGLVTPGGHSIREKDSASV